MQFLIDESRTFGFQKSKNMGWLPNIMAGVALPYEAKKKLLKKYPNLPKGSTLTDKQLHEILDDFINWKIQAVIVIGDHGGMTKSEMFDYRSNMMNNLETYALQNPLPISTYQRESLYKNLVDELFIVKSLANNDFAKMISICETTACLIENLIKNSNQLRDLDCRKLSVLIDDQVPEVGHLLKEFIHFYLWIESHDENRFQLPAGSTKFDKYFIKREKMFLNTAKLLKKTTTGDSSKKGGSKLDDIKRELKAADILANAAQKVLRGEIASDSGIIEKLKKIIKIKGIFHFRENLNDIEHIPATARMLLDLPLL